MKKKIEMALFGVVACMFALTSVSAASYGDWITGNDNVGTDYYGSKVKVNDNLTTLKGTVNAGAGMTYGPYINKDTLLTDGISEDTNVMLDPEKYTTGEFFDLNLALKTVDDNQVAVYVNEYNVHVERVAEGFKITSSINNDFSALVKEKGIYTLRLEAFVEETEGEEVPYAKFTLLQGERELATVKGNFDDIEGPDSLYPMLEQGEISFKYLWFCNIRAQAGVDVYTELPTVNLTFVDPTEDEDTVLPVYQYAHFTEEELEAFINELKEAAKKEGYAFEGLYADENYENEFDFLAPFTEDAKVYLKVSKLASEEMPPKTSDINLPLIIGMIAIAGIGAVFALKKRIAKGN